MQFRRFLIPVVSAGLALIQQASAFDIKINQYSCSRLLFTLTLTPTEFQNGAALAILNGPTKVSEVGLDGSFSRTVLSADFLATFFEGNAPTSSGPLQLTFILRDSDDDQLSSSAPVQRLIDFQCGTTVTVTASPSASPTSANGNANGATGTNSNSSSSGSNAGAIAGGVVGGLAALAIAGLLVFCLMRKRRRQQQSHSLGRHNVEESATPRPNDSTASLATAPEHVETPIMRDISTKNVFSDPSLSTAGSTLGAAAIAARKQSREGRPSNVSRGGDSQHEHVPPPLPAPVVAPTQPQPSAQRSDVPAASELSDAAPVSPQSKPEESGSTSSASNDRDATATAAVTAAATATSSKAPKTSKWGFKRNSQAEKGLTPADSRSLASSSPSQKSAEDPNSPPRSFKVIHKQSQPQSPATATAPTPGSPVLGANGSGSRSGFATPGSLRQGGVGVGGYSGAPSVTSLQAGFGEAPSMPPMAPGMAPAGPTASGSASASSMPVGDFAEAGNMAGIGAGASFQTNSFTGSTNSTKWHQQHYNVMPNYVSRPYARSTQLDDDNLIFGNIGMGLNAPPPSAPAGNVSESGSARSRRDPFSDA